MMKGLKSTSGVAARCASVMRDRGELLVAVGGQQRAHEARGLVGHLAERVAGQVRARVLVGGTLGRGRPAAEVDALDAHALHRHGLTGRVRAEGRDRLLLGEQRPQARVKALGCVARDGVVGRDRAPLLDNLSG